MHEMASKARTEYLAAAERHLEEQQKLEWDQHIRQQTLEGKEQQKAERTDLATKQKEKMQAVKKSGDKNALKALLQQCKAESQKADQDFLSQFVARKKVEDESQQKHFEMQKKRKNDEWTAGTNQLKGVQAADVAEVEERHSQRNSEAKKEIDKMRLRLLAKHQDEKSSVLIGQQDEELKLIQEQQQVEISLMISIHKQQLDQLSSHHAAVKKMHEEREKKDVAGLEKIQDAALKKIQKAQNMELEIGRKALSERLEELKDQQKAALTKLQATFKTVKASKLTPSSPEKSTHRRQASNVSQGHIFHPLAKDSYGSAARAPPGSTLVRGKNNATSRRGTSSSKDGRESASQDKSAESN